MARTLIFGLMICILGGSGFPSFATRQAPSRERTWPPSLAVSFLFWISLYLTVTALNLLDTNFVWSFFVIFGLSFVIFSSRLVWLLAASILLSYCWFPGLLSWPPTDDHLSAIFGMCIPFIPIAMMCVTIQYLTTERLKREVPLYELKQANAELEAVQHQLG